MNEDIEQYLEGHCNLLIGGKCYNSRCIVRGMQKHITIDGVAQPTCIEFEMYHLIVKMEEEIDDLSVQVTDYKGWYDER